MGVEGCILPDLAVMVCRPDDESSYNKFVFVGVRIQTRVTGVNGVDPKDEGLAWRNTVESCTEGQTKVAWGCEGAE